MKHAQTGATTIELAFVLLTFLMFLFGVLDVSRMLYTWNAATEATRAGARYAAVCASPANPAQVQDKMRRMLPEIGAVNIEWVAAPCAPGSCAVAPPCNASDASGCGGVTVTITSLNYHWISPLVGAVMPDRALPTFSTYLPREMMGQDANNAIICQ